MTEACRRGVRPGPDRYKLEDRKRDLARQIDQLTSDKRIVKARKEYEVMRDECERQISLHGSDRDRFKLDQIKAQEHAFLKATNPKSIQQRTEDLRSLVIGILLKQPEFLIQRPHSLCRQRSRLNDEAQASLLIESGQRAIQQQDFDKLRAINGQLIDLLPEEMGVQFICRVGAVLAVGRVFEMDHSEIVRHHEERSCFNAGRAK